jgi:nucleotide-binding universal stress UspA family protein
MLQKILLALDDRPGTEQILESGLMLAEKLGAQLLLLHVLNPLVPHGFVSVGNPLVGGILPVVDEQTIARYLEQWQEYEREGKERLESYADQARSRGIKVEFLQNYGDPGPMICEAATTWGADTIVMGRNQKPALSEILLGSTSNYVLHHASCSVMAIQRGSEKS